MSVCLFVPSYVHLVICVFVGLLAVYLCLIVTVELPIALRESIKIKKRNMQVNYGVIMHIHQQNPINIRYNP